jgi:hypothetical protein
MEEDNFTAEPDDPLTDLYWRDEILQLMYWLQGEALLADATPTELSRFLASAPGRLGERLTQLVQDGYLETVQGDENRYRLSALGSAEGQRRFVDEFAAFLGRDSHLTCGDRACICHTSTEPCPRRQER